MNRFITWLVNSLRIESTELETKRYIRWTEEEINFLITSYDLTNEEIADYLGRTSSSVASKRYILGKKAKEKEEDLL